MLFTKIAVVIVETPWLRWWERDVYVSIRTILPCSFSPSWLGSRRTCFPHWCFSRMSTWEASLWNHFISITSQYAFPAGMFPLESVGAAPAPGDCFWIACVSHPRVIHTALPTPPQLFPNGRGREMTGAAPSYGSFSQEVHMVWVSPKAGGWQWPGEEDGWLPTAPSLCARFGGLQALLLSSSRPCFWILMFLPLVLKYF